MSQPSNIIVHPGISLRRALLACGLSQSDFAKRIGMTEKHISQIIQGKASISPDVALKFERVLGGTADFWNDLQRNYQAAMARIEAEEKLKDELATAKKFDYPELVKCGLVPRVSSKDIMAKAENLLKFLRIDSFALWPSVEAVAFRKSEKQKISQEMLAAWLRYGELEAEKIVTEEFNRSRLQKAIPDLRKLTQHPANFDQDLKKICANVGVAVVLSPYFKNTGVGGATRWLNGKPVIQMSLRRKFCDEFWFTFFHELGHVSLHDKDTFIEFDGGDKPKEEQEADTFSIETLIPTLAYKTFVAHGNFDRASISSFAASQNVGAAIIAGRLAHDGHVSWAAIQPLRTRFGFVAQR